MRGEMRRRSDWPFSAMSDVLRSVAGALGEWPDLEDVPSGRWGPRVDVVDGDSEVIVRADLPGVKKEDLEVTATETELTISGKTSEEREEKRESYYRLERRSGQFSRTVDLPAPIKPDEVKAKLANGILELTAPKAEPVQPTGRTITIE
jgi:HSP20 family protein